MEECQLLSLARAAASQVLFVIGRIRSEQGREGGGGGRRRGVGRGSVEGGVGDVD